MTLDSSQGTKPRISEETPDGLESLTSDRTFELGRLLRAGQLLIKASPVIY